MTRHSSGFLLVGAGSADATNGSPGAALLAALDRALPVDTTPCCPVDGSAGRRRPEGLAAAVSLDALLVRNRLGWPDVLAPGHRLAKICGLLGSHYPAEQEAAYTHALRRIAIERSTWSALVHLPPNLGRELEEGRATLRPTSSVNLALLPENAAPTPPAPEADWVTTVIRLQGRMAWRSAAERLLLDELHHRLESGEPITTPDARLLRDMWWCAELNDPAFEETAT